MDNWESDHKNKSTNDVSEQQDRLNGNLKLNMVRCYQKRTMTRNGFEYTLKPACLENFEYVDMEDGTYVVDNNDDEDVNTPVTSSAARVIFCNHIGGSRNDCACCLPRVGECENLMNGNGDEASKTDDVKTGKDADDVCAKNQYGYEDNEPIHMTLEEVKDSLKQLYKNSEALGSNANNNNNNINNNCKEGGLEKRSFARKGAFHIHLRHRKSRSGNDSCEHDKRVQHRKSLPSSIRQTFCSLFGGKKSGASSKRVGSRGHSKSHEELSCSDVDSNLLNTPSRSIPSLSPFTNRALPPLPTSGDGADDRIDNDNEAEQENGDHEPVDFATSIRQVKDYGWYWGPISGEMAERILVGEPDGSFIVRDSSDNHYIFSLTFKLNGLVRHVRIEHDQGNFSFGTFTNFKSQTIVEFIENAVKHSRSGRYLFFLHRRPMLGPMRVQLLHPVSRFKQVQSLQHRCRFVLLKVVRWDLVDQLPLPKKLKDYLKTPQYYTEEVDVLRTDDTSNIVLPASTPEQHIVLGDMPELG